jgi:hypothetical protein
MQCRRRLLHVPLLAPQTFLNAVVAPVERVIDSWADSTDTPLALAYCPQNFTGVSLLGGRCDWVCSKQGSDPNRPMDGGGRICRPHRDDRARSGFGRTPRAQIRDGPAGARSRASPKRPWAARPWFLSRARMGPARSFGRGVGGPVPVRGPAVTRPIPEDAPQRVGSLGAHSGRLSKPPWRFRAEWSPRRRPAKG